MAKPDDDGLTAFERATLAEQKAHNARLQEIAAATAAKPQTFVDASPNEQFQSMADARRGRDNPPLATKVIEGIESQTGAKFDAKIDHHDKVVDLLHYTLPDGVDLSVDAGGLAPAGYPIGSVNHKHWKWTSFLQADINLFVGKPLPKHFIPRKVA